MTAPRRRLRYVDWLRGFAVLLMMQTHAYDAWLSPAAKETTFFVVSRYLGGYPAALFLFLAGVSLALVAHGRQRRGEPSGRIARQALGRAGMVLVYAVFFRLWMYSASGFTGREDLFRVDVLNCIGLSLGILAVVVLPWKPSLWIAGSALVAAVVALLTPLAWDGPWPAGISHRVAGYFSGRFRNALFPLFPWAAFTAAGAATGFLLARRRDSRDEGGLVALLALAGAVAIPAGWLLAKAPWTIGPRFDFWWTSPNYFLIKLGFLLVLLAAAFAFDRTPLAEGPSLVRTLGQASLFVYWLHVEIVYGMLVAPGIRGQLGIGGATACLLALVAAMAVIAAGRLGMRRGRRRGRSASPAQP